MNMFLNKNSLLAIILLLTVVGGVAIPQPAHAGLWGYIGCGALGVAVGAVTVGVGGVIAGGACAAAVAGSGGGGIIDTATAGFIDALSALLIFVGEGLFDMASTFLNYVITPPFVNTSLTNDPAYVQAWANVRDLTNMLIVLGFVFVGIATTIRWKDYEAKKVLPKLILVAILINFSGLMCEEMFKVSNTVQNAFLDNGGSTGVTTLGDNLQRNIERQKAEVKRVAGSDKTKAALSNLKFSAAAFVLYVFASIIFLILAILLAARYGILVILYIISPLAMFCFAFDSLKSHWRSWWERFLQWCFVGAIAGFLIFLASSTLKNGGGGVGNFFVSMVFLFLAYRFAKSGAAKGSAAILGMAAAGASMAMGGVGKMAKIAGGQAAEQAKRTNAGRATNEWVADKWDRAKERLRLAPQGSRAANQQKRQSDAKTQLENLRNSSNAADKAKYQNWVRNGKGAMGAEAVAMAAEKGELGKIMGNDFGKMSARAAYASQFGKKWSDLSKADPRLAQFDQEKLNDNLRKRGFNPAGTIDARTMAQEKDKLIREALSGMAPSKVAEMHHSNFTPEVVAGLSQEQLKEIGKKGSPELINHLKKFKRARDASGNALPATDPNQTSEYKNLYKHIDSTYGVTLQSGQNSAQAQQAAQVLDDMEQNSAFS